MSLKKIRTIKDLSLITNISEDDIKEFINNKSKYVEKQNIEKKSGGTRQVYSILSNKYKTLVRFIYEELYSLSDFHECVHGFVKKRGIISNAKKHLNKSIIINIDIKDFFESITIEQTYTTLMKLGLGKKLVHIIVSLIIYDGKLPAGFPTSPLISNLVCAELDKEFLSYSNKNHYTYSRYGDDITLSTDIENNYLKKEDIGELLGRHGFIANDKKYKLQKKGRGLYVTGLTVCEKDNPRIPKYIKRRLRQEAYYIKKFGLKSHIDMVGEKSMFFNYGCKSIKGRIDYIKPLEAKLADYIRQLTKKELMTCKKKFILK